MNMKKWVEKKLNLFNENSESNVTILLADEKWYKWNKIKKKQKTMNNAKILQNIQMNENVNDF